MPPSQCMWYISNYMLWPHVGWFFVIFVFCKPEMLMKILFCFCSSIKYFGKWSTGLLIWHKMLGCKIHWKRMCNKDVVHLFFIIIFYSEYFNPPDRKYSRWCSDCLPNICLASSLYKMSIHYIPQLLKGEGDMILVSICPYRMFFL